MFRDDALTVALLLELQAGDRLRGRAGPPLDGRAIARGFRPGWWATVDDVAEVTAAAWATFHGEQLTPAASAPGRPVSFKPGSRRGIVAPRRDAPARVAAELEGVTWIGSARPAKTQFRSR